MIRPGETPLDDISGLKDKRNATRAVVGAREAENILAATALYFTGRLTKKKARFDLSWGCELHRQMFGDVWDWGGTFRVTELTNGAFVKPHQIETKLACLFDDMVYWKEDWLFQAALLHHRAVQIHPFPNGNGRWSRMLANIWLRLKQQPHTLWPNQLTGPESVIRGDYLIALRRADEGDYETLVALHKSYTPERQPPIVHQAKEYLMQSLGWEEHAAYRALQRRAMSTRSTMAKLAADVLSTSASHLEEMFLPRTE